VCVAATLDRDSTGGTFAAMCGIAGLFAKTPSEREQLGTHLSDMLGQLAFRGPDSAAPALYRRPAPEGRTKVSLFSPAQQPDWVGLAEELGGAFDGAGPPAIRATHAVIEVGGEAEAIVGWLGQVHPELTVMSAGQSIEIYKQVGHPRAFAERFGLYGLTGTHALGHTRMATESRVTTAGSHPFSTGLDLCLVHNGSLSNHNRLRRELMREGITFQTENDSEVAAGYLTWRLREGATLEQALEGCLEDLDGFYTFAVGTADGFAVLRDPIACKPAVMAETDEWVAMASEYRAIAVLPGAEDARTWEPEPGQVYSWGTTAKVA
jgi:glutamate synthase domain-containing protein 1